MDPPDGSVITGFEGQQHFEITCQIIYGGMFPVETEWRLLTADAQEEGSGGIGPVVIDADNDERFSFEDAGNSKLIIDILAPELNQSEIFCHETHTLERELVASFALMTTRQYPMNAICVCVQGFCLVFCSPEINGYCNISLWPQTSVAFLLYNTLLEDIHVQYADAHLLCLVDTYSLLRHTCM